MCVCVCVSGVCLACVCLCLACVCLCLACVCVCVCVWRVCVCLCLACVCLCLSVCTFPPWLSVSGRVKLRNDSYASHSRMFDHPHHVWLSVDVSERMKSPLEEKYRTVMLLLKPLKSVFITWNKGKIKYTYYTYTYILYIYIHLKWKLEMLPWQQLK